MKCIFLFLVFALTTVGTAAQQHILDSLKHDLVKTADDSVRFRLLVHLGELYAFINADSAIHYVKQATALAERKKSPLWQAHATIGVSYYFFVTGDIASALEAVFENINGYQKYQDARLYTASTTFIGILYMNNSNYKEAMSYAAKSLQLCDTMRLRNNLYSAHINSTKEGLMIEDYMVLAMSYLHFNKLDSALHYGQKAYDLDIKHQLNNNYPLYRLALIYSTMGNTGMALSLFRRAVLMAYAQNIVKDVIDNYNGMAEVFKNMGQTDSIIFYTSKVIELSKESNYKRGALEANLLLSEAYEKKGRKDSAFQYYRYAMAAKDTLFNQEKMRQVQRIAFKEELKEREIQQKAAAEQTQYRSRIRLYLALGTAAVLLAIALLLWRNNRQKQKANALLQVQKEQTELALKELRATQAQLIQSEKMASLGELTAGIAHEIQNPLNFINNFSEINIELVNEMEEEADRGAIDEVKTISYEIKENSEKIAHHGKRADAIVKGMLQHSRKGTGQKELTDINALAEEHLRLSYHSLRAKDKTFNASLQTDFDASIGKIDMIPQDIGRVLLNLFNNAFYAVHEKAKKSGEGYEPTVVVSTKKLADKIEIVVQDNGMGISKSLINKIFQPFFTTKPTGQGTGLGLSLSYDIIKAHGGEIKAESDEGEGAVFMIRLPVQNAAT